MPISFLKPSRTVLLIADQALYIYAVSAKGTDLVETVPWTAQNFEQNVATIISKECGNNPILILNDMVEQHYRKEKIPKVGPLDKSNVIERKLLVSFPNYPIRAALPLKEKLKKTDKKTGGELYIFAAVPMSDPFAKTMGAARQATANIAGFCLLPVESSDMVKKLSEKLMPKEKAKWTVFIGQHQSGGLRQIVTKNGELALTRMTPVMERGADNNAWISEVYQEFKATMSYLTRFGFDPSDGLNIILVADHEATESMESALDVSCKFIGISPDDAAAKLGLKLQGGEEAHYCDALHAAWSGSKSSFLLPMKSKEIDSVSKPRRIATALSLLLFFGAAFQIYQLSGYVQSLQTNWGDIDTAVRRKADLDIQFQKEVERKQDLGFDIQLIQSSMSAKADFDKYNLDVLDLFYRIGFALGRDMRIDSLSVNRQEKIPLVLPGKNNKGKSKNKDKNKEEASETAPTLYIADLELSFPSTIDAEKGNKDVQDLQSRIQKMMPSSVVKITKLLEDYKYSEEIVVQTGNIKDNKEVKDYVAQIQIEKKLQQND